MGGVNTHEDLHVAAVVVERGDDVGTHCFPRTRQGYRQMRHWMRFVRVGPRVGVESTETYGARLHLVSVRPAQNYQPGARGLFVSLTWRPPGAASRR